jgi:hypothetical protein
MTSLIHLSVKEVCRWWIATPFLAGIALSFLMSYFLNTNGGVVLRSTNSKHASLLKPIKVDISCPYCRQENKNMLYRSTGSIACANCSSELTCLEIDDHFHIKQPSDFFESYIPGGHTRMTREIILKNISERNNQVSWDRASDEIIISSWFNTYRRIKYTGDPPGMDIWNRAEKTWRTRSGDCEDHAILLTDFLITQGFNARVAVGLWKKEGHAWVVVNHRGREYLLEQIGNLSPRFPPRVETYSKDYEPYYSFDRDAIYYPIEFNKKATTYFSETKWRKTLKQNIKNGY